MENPLCLTMRNENLKLSLTASFAQRGLSLKNVPLEHPNIFGRAPGPVEKGDVLPVAALLVN